MRKQRILLALTTFLVLIVSTPSHAQSSPELWGMTKYAGENGEGCIFKTDSVGTNYQMEYSFGDNPLKYPGPTHFCEANGKLYGLCNAGIVGAGILFEYDPATNTYSKKWDFAMGIDGSNPQGSLMLASNGKLYGMTVEGGSNGLGVLFEYDPVTETFTKKLDFSGASNGSNPYGSLVQASNGKLYGTTYNGGSNGMGVLFEYDLSTSVCTKKLDFTGVSTGSFPKGSLMEASNGKLYGMTTYGGTNSDGVLFEYDPATNIFIKKMNFANVASGKYPVGSLIQATNGKLYGMTWQGGSNSMGVLFEFDLATSVYTKRLNFAGTTNGGSPRGSLMQASNGMIYGLTRYGGSSDWGVLFEYNPTTNTYAKKIDFDDVPKGREPLGSLMEASNGKLYGMTSIGGHTNYGVLFEYTPTTSTFTKKVDLGGISTGRWPLGSLMQATNGKIYGTAYDGGDYGNGVLFEFDRTTSTYIKKHDFAGGGDGAWPYWTLTEASNGKLYGMTYIGGAYTYNGVLFEYDPVSEVYTKKLDFDGANNGKNPVGSLMRATNGKFYGMTSHGGSHDYGVLFEYDPISSTYTKKLDFTGSFGTHPSGSIIEGSNGKFYGTTYDGGFNSGVLFEYDLITDTCISKQVFLGFDGKNPTGSVIQASNGKLYGLTENGGINSMGILYEYDIIADTCIKRADFAGISNGRYPHGSLMQASNGKIYGMTSGGGNRDYGVLFEFDIDNDTLLKKLDLIGGQPDYTSLIEICHPPALSAQPISAYLCSYTDTSFSVQAQGHGIIYQWQENSGSGFVNINDNAIYQGTDSATLHISLPPFSMNGFAYRCVITSTCSVAILNSNVVTLDLLPAFLLAESQDICNGQTYTWRGNTYNATGSYHEIHTAANGCDSTYTLNLAVNPEYTFNETGSFCNGQTYNWHGQNLTASGTFYDSHSSVNGCDSTYTLTLTLNPVYAYTESHSICNGQAYAWHGQSLTTAGTFYDNRTTMNGCDSTYTLTLTVFPSYDYSETHSICNGQTYAWHGQSLAAAGTYYDNHTSINGCDSTYTLTLSENPVFAYSVYDTICAGDTLNWQGSDYSTAGTFNTLYSSVNGCDSTHTLYLYLETLPVVSFSGLNSLYCVYDPLVTLTGSPTGGTFSGAGISGNTFDPNVAGAGTHDIIYSYTDGNLCTNSDTITVVVDLCIGINELSTNTIAIYPNPSSGSFTLELGESASVEIYNAVGSLIYSEALDKGKHTISLTLADGVYLLKAANNKGNQTKRMVICNQ